MDELRKLAAEATKGPWIARTYDNLGRTPVVVDNRNFVIAGEGFLVGGMKDAAYIAACSPERILALLAIVELVEVGDAYDNEGDKTDALYGALAALSKAMK